MKTNTGRASTDETSIFVEQNVVVRYSGYLRTKYRTQHFLANDLSLRKPTKNIILYRFFSFSFYFFLPFANYYNSTCVRLHLFWDICRLEGVDSSWIAINNYLAIILPYVLRTSSPNPDQPYLASPVSKTEWYKCLRSFLFSGGRSESPGRR